MLHVELRVLEGRQAGKTIPLHVRQFLIGREQDCHLRPNSDLVSRHHCVFTLDEFTVRLRDLGSTNGTYVNGERLQGQVVLKAGDRVSVGKLAFEMLMQEQAAPTSPAELPIDPVADEQFETAADSSATIEFPAVTPTDDTTIFAALETATGMPVSLPPGYVQQMPYQQMPYGMPQQGYGMPGYPQGYGMPGYPPPGYPQQYQPQYQVPGYAPQQGFVPGYGMPQMMPGYTVPGVPMEATAVTAAPAVENAAKSGGEAPPMVLPDPESTGVKAPPAPPPAAPGDPSAPVVVKPSDAAADIIRNQRLRRT